MTKLQNVIQKWYGKEAGARFYKAVTAPAQLARLRKIYESDKAGGASSLDRAVRKLLSADATLKAAKVGGLLGALPYGAAIDLLSNRVSGRKEVRKYYQNAVDEMIAYPG